MIKIYNEYTILWIGIINMKKKEKLLNKLKAVFEIALYCISLSWQSSKLYTIIRLGGKILTPFIGIGSVVLGKYILDLLSGAMKVQNKESTLIFLISALVFLGVLNIVMQRIQDYAMSMQNDILVKDMSKKMMERGSLVDMEYFYNPEFYNIFALARNDMHSVISVMWNSIDCISAFITFMWTFLFLCGINPLYAIFMIIVSVPSAVANQQYIKDLFKINVNQIKDERKLNHLYDIAAGKEYAEDVRLFNIGGLIRTRYLDLWTSLFVRRKKIIRKGAFRVGLLDTLPQLVIFFIILDITLKILNGTGTVGDYSLYYGILNQLSGSIYIASMSIMRIYDDKLRIDNVKKLENVENKIKNFGTDILSKVHNIEFQNVCFTYPNTEKLVLDDVSFSIQKREKVALVGVNGAGKSTVIKLLLRFYEVDSGQILINRTDIREYELNSLRRAFSSYFQKPTTYGFSLKENVIIGDYETYDGNDDAVLRALEESNAEGMLEKLPNHLETYLTRNFEEDGAELSIGQYQKIALARTFFRRSSAIILDEPSASLDPEAEHKVFERLNKLCKDKTTLFTSHRLSNISIADKIVVLEHGKVIEQGTHAQLIAEPKRYAVLYKYQADKFNLV